MISLELPVFLREHHNGMYKTHIYLFCKQLAELPFFILQHVIFVSIFYFLVGLNSDPERFFACLGVVLLISRV